ncbi:MAG TPA: LamG-like jellyroll fold domain-containing protein [Methylomirabilota bacterium]|nr:LamG-like jellyroll fold domain-containing protein [Methylomirabilota bacterium]
MKISFKPFVPIVAILGSFVVSMVAARADVLHYQCGEADPGAADGVVATNSRDSAGINNLILRGGPMYSSDHPAGDTNSSLSLQFNGANYGLAQAIVLQTNFTAEVWVKPATDTAFGTILYDGNGEDDYFTDVYGTDDLDGWGFFQHGNYIVAHLGNGSDFGALLVVTNVWTHLALVCTNGITMFLVDGQTNAIANLVPNPSTEYLNVGGWSDGTAGFIGSLDDVRVSMFVPLTLTASWMPGQVALYWPAVYPNYCVQYVTNLAVTNWTSVSEQTSLLNGQLTLTNVSTDAARFYRLAPAGPPYPVVYIHGPEFHSPVFPQPPLIAFRDTLPLEDQTPDQGIYFDPCGYVASGYNNNTIAVICNIPTKQRGSLFIGSTYDFDASASIDPRSFSNGSLSFHWNIYYPDAYGGGSFSSPYITNYDSPILTIPANSMQQLPFNQYDPQATYMKVELTIQHQPYDPNAVPSEQTIVWFRFAISGTVVVY